MKTGKHYIQVFIESEDDLPKEDGNYFVHFKQYGNATTPYWKVNLARKYTWLDKIDWYLLPVEQPQQIEFTTYCDKCNRIMVKKEVISLICMNPECENYIKKQTQELELPRDEEEHCTCSYPKPHTYGASDKQYFCVTCHKWIKKQMK